MEFHNSSTLTGDYSYPFSAIMGQEEMKRALILNAIEPRIGGVLIRGEKGTAKSTAVRALRRLLPEIKVVRGCSCLCDPDSPLRACPQCEAKIKEGIYPESGYIKVPLVTLPLNATEEMVTGSPDLEFAMRKGQRRFQPGLLARVNRGILYIDEVNLLDDHLVDIILDAVSSGINVVEREGLSYLHPSRFILAGTMNPEEGALRPQLLDRFGLCVEISGEGDLDNRVRLMEMRDSFDNNPVEFAARHLKEDKGIAERIRRAGERLKGVVFPQRLLGLVSEICLQNNVAGHRADMSIKYAARALAAWEGRFAVTVGDINRVAGMAILHRKRDVLPPPPPSPGPVDPDKHEDPGDSDEQKQQGQNSSADNNDINNQPREDGEDPGGESDGMEEEDYQQGLPDPESSTEEDDPAGVTEQVFEPGRTFRVQSITQEKDRLVRRGSGRRTRTRTTQKSGRYVKSVKSDKYPDIAIDATIRAAAPHQGSRKKESGMAISIRNDDIRKKIREKRVGNFLIFMVDASGSMGAKARMIATKGAILSLLLDAYQKRDKVAMVTFRQRKAVVNLPPTSSVELAVRHLSEMPVGGRTPMSEGLLKGFNLLGVHLLKEPSSRPIAIIVTDGRANATVDNRLSPQDEVLRIAGEMSREKRIKFVVIDTEEKAVVRFGLAARLAAALGAEHFSFNDLRAGDIVNIVRRNI